MISQGQVRKNEANSHKIFWEWDFYGKHIVRGKLWITKHGGGKYKDWQTFAEENIGIKEENNRIDKLLPRMARIPKTMLMTQMISQGRVWPPPSLPLVAAGSWSQWQRKGSWKRLLRMIMSSSSSIVVLSWLTCMRSFSCIDIYFSHTVLLCTIPYY